MGPIVTRNLLIVVAALSLASCDAGNGKNDIIGFKPGMTKADVHALADSHNWSCSNRTGISPMPAGQEMCHTSGGEMTVIYATNIDGWLVWELSFQFSPGIHGDGVVESQIKDISDQYGKKPDRVVRPDGFIVQALWNLDNGNVLTLGNLGILDLQNLAMVTEAEKAADRKAVQANPTPKF
jgi:hypothetical protein